MPGLPVPFRNHSLVAGVLLTSCVVTAALAWSGWRLVVQQRELDARALRQGVDAAADAFAADLRERLADEGERLERWLAGATPPMAGAPPGCVALAVRATGARIDRHGLLPFVPALGIEGPAPPPDSLFAGAERAEFALRQPALATTSYRRLSNDPRAEVRAGALLRLGRILRAQRDLSGALAASSALAALGDSVRAGDVPATLAGLDASRLAYEANGDGPAVRRVAEQIRDRLDAGDWPIDRTTAEFYRELASDTPLPPQWHLAAVLGDAWEQLETGAAAPRGVRAVETPAGVALAWWRTNAGVRAVAVALADPVLRSLAPQRLDWRVSDAEDRLLSGSGDAPRGDVLVAAHAVGGGAGWSLQVWPRTSATGGATVKPSLLLLALGGTLLFVWAATALMLRAIAHEAGVARLQSDFVAAVSHEFRSPLTAMRQMAEMLDAERVPDEARRKQYYRVLAGEAARLQHLVETLLDFGRMEAGRAPASRGRVGLGDLVAAVVDEVRLQPRAAGARIEIVPPDHEVTVDGDPDGLRLALRNLLENAVKYSPRNAQITVSWRADGGHAALDVVDRGLGIAPHEHARIFRKFVRGESATAAHVGGTGVGLAIVQQVVDAHGGEVRLRSRPGEGSTFTLRLPLAASVTKES
jgi:signal transduction histidine kinase